MPASIIEDSSLLKPAGRVICITLFFAGVVLMLTAMSYIGWGVEILKSHNAKERALSITDSIPEEMSFVLPPTTFPKTREEKIARTRETGNILNLLAQDAKRSPQFRNSNDKINDPKKIVAIGVLNGFIHPKEAQKILQEVSILEISMDETGNWDAPN